MLDRRQIRWLLLSKERFPTLRWLTAEAYPLKPVTFTDYRIKGWDSDRSDSLVLSQPLFELRCPSQTVIRSSEGFLHMKGLLIRQNVITGPGESLTARTALPVLPTLAARSVVNEGLTQLTYSRMTQALILLHIDFLALGRASENWVRPPHRSNSSGFPGIARGLPGLLQYPREQASANQGRYSSSKVYPVRNSASCVVARQMCSDEVNVA